MSYDYFVQLCRIGRKVRLGMIRFSKRSDDMPNHILTMDVMDEMLYNISVIKLNTYIKLSNDKKQLLTMLVAFFYFNIKH